MLLLACFKRTCEKALSCLFSTIILSVRPRKDWGERPVSVSFPKSWCAPFMYYFLFDGFTEGTSRHKPYSGEGSAKHTQIPQSAGYLPTDGTLSLYSGSQPIWPEGGSSFPPCTSLFHRQTQRISTWKAICFLNLSLHPAPLSFYHPR